jgi:hypothetical protein
MTKYQARLRHGIVFVKRAHEHADMPPAVALLRERRERPRRRAAEECEELASFHSMTSVAIARSTGGTVRPSAFAVLRLMTSSNLVGWMRQVARLLSFQNAANINA